MCLINSIFYNKPVISKSTAQNKSTVKTESSGPIYTKCHSTPHGAKSLRIGHDPSENLIKICQVVKYKTP